MGFVYWKFLQLHRTGFSYENHLAVIKILKTEQRLLDTIETKKTYQTQSEPDDRKDGRIRNKM